MVLRKGVEDMRPGEWPQLDDDELGCALMKPSDSSAWLLLGPHYEKILHGL